METSNILLIALLVLLLVNTSLSIVVLKKLGSKDGYADTKPKPRKKWT